MTKLRSANDLTPMGSVPPSSPAARESRISVRNKAFVDFCEVPEVGDVNDQDVLYVDGLPVLRGSPRRVDVVAKQVQKRAHEAKGLACLRLTLLHLTVDAQQSATVGFVSRTPVELFALSAFGGVSVTALSIAGRQLALVELPEPVPERASVEVTLHNAHDEALQAELVLCCDEAPAG